MLEFEDVTGDDFNSFVDNVNQLEDDPYYSIPAVSNSAMYYINPEQGGSPRAFKNFVDNLADKKETYQLTQGKLLHTWNLEPDKFLVSEIDKPTTQIGAFTEHVYALTRTDSMGVTMGLNTAYKLAYERVGFKRDKFETVVKKFQEDEDMQAYFAHLCKQDGKICIPKKMSDTLEACRNSIINNNLASELLFATYETDVKMQAFNEIALFHTYVAEYEQNGETKTYEIKVKGKLDRVIINHYARTVTIVDLKTTGRPIFEFNLPTGGYRKYRYYRQQAFYEMLVIEALRSTIGVDIEGYDIEHRIVAVETTGLFQCKVFGTDLGCITKGTQEYEALLSRIAWHYANYEFDQSIEEYENSGLIEVQYDKVFTA